LFILQLRKLHVGGMAFFPFIIIKSGLSEERKKVLINHERIHLRQQLELLVLPFYVIYLFNYLLNLIRYGRHDTAYKKIIFEKEAFLNEKNFDYLKNRKMWKCFLRDKSLTDTMRINS
jgi:hypothetical protein